MNREQSVQEMVIPTDLGLVNSIRDEIGLALDDAGFDSGTVAGMKLAMEEAIVNAMNHGNDGEHSRHVRITYQISDEKFWIEIEDEGTGFCVENVPDPTSCDFIERPGGRGILLMRSCMDHVEYSENGNVVSMSKIRVAAESTPSPSESE